MFVLNALYYLPSKLSTMFNAQPLPFNNITAKYLICSSISGDNAILRELHHTEVQIMFLLEVCTYILVHIYISNYVT